MPDDYWEDAKRTAQSPFHDDQAQEREPLTEHQALGLAISALQQVPSYQPELMGDLQAAYERGKIPNRSAEITPEMFDMPEMSDNSEMLAKLEQYGIALSELRGLGLNLFDGHIVEAFSDMEKTFVRMYQEIEAASVELHQPEQTAREVDIEPERDREIEPDL